jgi:hypothetical protein
MKCVHSESLMMKIEVKEKYCDQSQVHRNELKIVIANQTN